MITHEMEVIRDICNRVAVMENGRIIETGNVLEIFLHQEKRQLKILSNQLFGTKSHLLFMNS